MFFPFCQFSSSFMAYFYIKNFIFSWSHISEAFFFFKKVFIYLAAPGLRCGMRGLQSSLQHARSLVAACGLFSCGMQTFSCGMWDLVPWPGVEPRPPIWGELSLSHWTTREVPMKHFSYRTFSLLLEEKEKLFRLELFHFPVFWYVSEYKIVIYFYELKNG